MKKAALIVAAIVACCTSPVAAQLVKGSPPQAIPLCSVIANATDYDGKEVSVRGMYRMVIHGAILMDHGCPDADVNLRQSPEYKADKKASKVLRSVKDPFQPVEVVFHGVFRVAHEGQCFGQICARYEIEATALMSAVPPKPSEK